MGLHPRPGEAIMRPNIKHTKHEIKKVIRLESDGNTSKYKSPSPSLKNGPIPKTCQHVKKPDCIKGAYQNIRFCNEGKGNFKITLICYRDRITRR